jgi:predicted RNase H-like HicB family nuclease
MFEFRLRILEAGEGSYLGVVEGFPTVLVHARSATDAEQDLVRALVTHLERLLDREATRIQLDDFPTVRISRLVLDPSVG